MPEIENILLPLLRIIADGGITADGRTYLEQHWSNWSPSYSVGARSEAAAKAWETRKSHAPVAQETLESMEQEKRPSLSSGHLCKSS